LRKLTARIDRYDYKLDPDSTAPTLKLHSGYEVKLRLVAPRGRVEKFRNWGNYELVVKYDGDGFWVAIYFKRAVKPAKPKTVMAIDVNFDNLTLAVFTLDGRLVRRSEVELLEERFGVCEERVRDLEERLATTQAYLRRAVELLRKSLDPKVRESRNLWSTYVAEVTSFLNTVRGAGSGQ